MLRIDKVWAVLVVFLASACWILPGADCFGQGFLLISEHDHPIRLPRPFPPHPPIERPNPEVLYRVKHLEVDTRIRDSIARVQLSQTFVNEGSQVVEARCIVPLPYDVVVSDVTFMVDGQEIVGKLLPVAEANQIYQGTFNATKIRRWFNGWAAVCFKPMCFRFRQEKSERCRSDTLRFFPRSMA